MEFEGRFWLLWEEEPIHIDRTRVYDIRDGVIRDGRSGALCGTCAEVENGIDLRFSKEDGDYEIAEIRMTPTVTEWGGKFVRVPKPFDPTASTYPVTYTTAKLEAHRTSLPANDHETIDEETDRLDRELETFGSLRTYGAMLRDGPAVYEMHERNMADERECLVQERRKQFAAV